MSTGRELHPLLLPATATMLVEEPVKAGFAMTGATSVAGHLPPPKLALLANR